MIRTLALAALILILPACAARTFKTLMRGAMTMDGDMRVDGDMQMDGDMTMDGGMEMTGQLSTVMKTDNTASPLSSVAVYAAGSSQAASRIAVIDIDGLLVNRNISGLGSLGENPVALFREKLDTIATDPSVAAIVLRINSPGGGVTAADIMARDLHQVRTQRNLPIVACLMDVGAGSGYYVSSAADSIIAHPTSLVGGIGVILNLYNMELAISQFNIASIPIKAGEKIDIASPERMMEDDERKLLQGMADEFHQRFIDLVRQRRPQVDEDLLDGRVMTGTTAFDAGLVDQVGYLDDAVVLARQLAHLPEDAPVVMLRRDNDRAYTLLDISPNTPTMSSLIPLKMPGLDRSSLPTFLYLWHPEPSFVTASGG